MKYKLFLILALAATIIFSCGGAVDDTEDDVNCVISISDSAETEPNDSLGEALLICSSALIYDDFTITGTVNDYSDNHDYFELTPNYSGSINITLSDFETNDLDLVLNSEGFDVDSSISYSSSETISFDLESNTIYYIYVIAMDTDSNDTTYTLTINFD